MDISRRVSILPDGSRTQSAAELMAQRMSSNGSPAAAPAGGGSAPGPLAGLSDDELRAAQQASAGQRSATLPNGTSTSTLALSIEANRRAAAASAAPAQAAPANVPLPPARPAELGGPAASVDRGSVAAARAERGQGGANSQQLSGLAGNFGAPPAQEGKATAYKADGRRGVGEKAVSNSGSVERILRDQGWSLKDIYSKDKSGKTLVDKFVKDNGLKDAKSLKPGQSYKVPEKQDHYDKRMDAAGKKIDAQVGKPAEPDHAAIEKDVKAASQPGADKKIDAAVGTPDAPDHTGIAKDLDKHKSIPGQIVDRTNGKELGPDPRQGPFGPPKDGYDESGQPVGGTSAEPKTEPTATPSSEPTTGSTSPASSEPAPAEPAASEPAAKEPEPEPAQPAAGEPGSPGNTD